MIRFEVLLMAILLRCPGQTRCRIDRRDRTGKVLRIFSVHPNGVRASNVESNQSRAGINFAFEGRYMKYHRPNDKSLRLSRHSCAAATYLANLVADTVFEANWRAIESV